MARGALGSIIRPGLMSLRGCFSVPVPMPRSLRLIPSNALSLARVDRRMLESLERLLRADLMISAFFRQIACKHVWKSEEVHEQLLVDWR